MTRSDGFTLKGWHVLAGMIAFFAIVLAMDAATIVFAYRSFPGESTRNPYEAGLAYNATLARRSREAALGWRVEAEAVPAGLVVFFQDRAGRPLDGLSLSGRLTRPATENGSVGIVFRPDGPGRYAAARPAQSGGWDLEVIARDLHGNTLQADRRLLWR